MTFDEWHKANAKYMEPVDIVDWCREAYEAGLADENEGCAALCESHPHPDSDSDFAWASRVCAAKIRERGQG